MSSNSLGVFPLPPAKKKVENHKFGRKNLKLWNHINWAQDPAYICDYITQSVT